MPSFQTLNRIFRALPYLAIIGGAILLALVCSGYSLAAHGAEVTIDHPAYAKAFAEAERTGKPLVVQVGADWCGPCKQVARDYGAAINASGAYVHLDVDRDREVCRRLGIAGPVPRLYVWHREKGHWVKGPKVYVGTDQIKIFVEGR